MEGKAAETCARAREMHSTLPEARHCNRLLRLLVERLRWVDARKLYDEMLAEEGGADNYSTVGGESLDQLSKRCVSYLNMIADKHKVLLAPSKPAPDDA
ncbi:hypothetical protein SETIT_8G024100v2 [Setaria italica]|uniref:Uncharacterized protein n=1 Tax=Setaria italica TaxID=4555 RepID=A0A368S3L3_SETIT|nr:hypothetical protein SETIT_8G024100v2 [Setaria italica]